MKLFRYFIDGVQLQDDPIGWDEAKWVIFRQKELNALLQRIDLQLEFHGDGYAALASAYDAGGYCGTVEIEIQELKNDGTYRRVHNGLIRLSTLTRDRKTFTIKTPIEDNSFYAKVNNNKGIAAFPFAERSKNDTAIASAPLSFLSIIKLCDCSVYSRLTGTLSDPDNTPYYTGAGYRVFDLFQYLVTFMSDGAVDFQSTVFDTGGDYDGLIVTCGEVFKTYLTGTSGTAFKGNFPKISFQQLFKECDKKLHLGMMIDNSGARPKLVIEYDSYFRQTTSMHACNDIDKVVETTDVSKLYAKLVLGSSKTLSVSVQCPPNGLDFPERVSLLGFKEEEFIIIGDCNLDTELNLRSDFVISSNIIEDCVENGASNNDTDAFFIMCEPYYGDWITKTGNIFNQPTPCQYNIDLNNVNSMQRWLSGIPNSIAVYTASVDDRFLATDTLSNTSVAAQNQFRFDDDYTSPNYDTNGNYGNLTVQGNPVSQSDSRFTSPADGLYTFEENIILNILSLIPNATFPNFNQLSLIYNLRLFDSGNVLIQDFIEEHDYHPSDVGINNISLSQTVYMSTGDYVYLRIYRDAGDLAPCTYYFPIGNTFACTATATGGGIYQNIDPHEYAIINHVFDKDITPDDFETILSDPRGLVICDTHQSYSFSGWIEELSFTRAKGNGKWKLFSSFNLNQ